MEGVGLMPLNKQASILLCGESPASNLLVIKLPQSLLQLPWPCRGVVPHSKPPACLMPLLPGFPWTLILCPVWSGHALPHMQTEARCLETWISYLSTICIWRVSVTSHSYVPLLAWKLIIFQRACLCLCWSFKKRIFSDWGETGLELEALFHVVFLVLLYCLCDLG